RGVRAERVLVVRDRLVALTLLREEEREVRVRLGIARVPVERLPVARDGLVDPARASERHPEPIARLRVARLERNRLGILLHRVRRAAALEERVAEIEPRP